MYNLSPKNKEVLESLCKLTPAGLAQTVKAFLKKKYSDIDIGDKYIYAVGKIPVLVVAHMDTVFPKPPINIYYDSVKDTMWSPEGVGADDRAGVFSILKLLQRGYRPYVLFTDEEETGGIGAASFIQNHPDCPDVKYVIEFDRQGEKDCVFYDCDNRDFVSYIEKFGFEEEYGTFTDISIICPVWRVAGVNLSVGYIDEHSYTEILHPMQTMKTISAACRMLDEIDSVSTFKYIPMKYSYTTNIFKDYYFGDNNESKEIGCDCCKHDYPEEDLFEVLYQDGHTGHLCLDCIDRDAGDRFVWCSKCGGLYESLPYEENIDYNRLFLCPDCYKKALKEG